MTLGYATWFFYVLAAMAVVSALMVVTRRNPVHSAMFLVFTFFCVAGIYITMSAEFLAAVQVLVYAGGIVVLFLFVIMLVPLQAGVTRLPVTRGAAALLIVALLFTTVMTIYARAARSCAAMGVQTEGPAGNIEAVGIELYTRYLLPFEVASILLLVAMVGAVVLARRET
ncbi:MAG: NADH-quinone oxidoreductase subunit J [Acidobacteria bacterium]|nr:NADH-quinone oxidoreductase subunit J [Acidobacteriota bacterium]